MFSVKGIFKKTCYSSFSNNNGQKGWCTTRKPGVFVNGFPTEDSGWGFCSNDDSQDQCNVLNMKSKEDDTPYPVSFIPEDNCFQALKENLEVEQPAEVNDKFKKVVDDSDTFCVGQFHEHSFANEKFVSCSKGVCHNLSKTSQLKVNLNNFHCSVLNQCYFLFQIIYSLIKHYIFLFRTKFLKKATHNKLISMVDQAALVTVEDLFGVKFMTTNPTKKFQCLLECLVIYFGEHVTGPRVQNTMGEWCL